MQIGYDPEFIGDGIKVPLPTFNRSLGQSVLRLPGELRDDIYSDHIHFTVVMNEHTRQLVYSAYNIDQKKFRKDAGGKRSWRNDPNFDGEFQTDNDYYKDQKGPTGEVNKNPYDRGHMVMRFNNMWGATKAEADKAGKATFIYSNASLQHENLNRDEWKFLEMNVVRSLQGLGNGKLSVFTGPIFGDLDRHVHVSNQDSARVPSGFFKVICFRLKDAIAAEKLGVLAFAIFQDEKVLRDKKGGATVKTDRRYQVTITELQRLTGINFGKQLFERNPLFYFDNQLRNEAVNVHRVPERIPINDGENLIATHTEVRCDVEPLSERQIVLNSAMINPKGRDKTGEWVSFHNRGARKTTLKNWRLVDGHGREATINGAIEAGESLRIKGRGLGKVKLANTGGSLMLFDEHNCVIDHVTWSGHDLKRIAEGVAYMFERGQ